MRDFDTSVIFSLYINEARTPHVDAELQIAFHSTLRAGDSLHLGIVLVENHLLVTGDDDLAQLAQALGLATVHIP